MMVRKVSRAMKSKLTSDIYVQFFDCYLQQQTYNCLIMTSFISNETKTMIFLIGSTFQIKFRFFHEKKNEAKTMEIQYFSATNN